MSTHLDLGTLIKLVLFTGHVWYNFLDAVVEPNSPKSNKAVILKMLADQVLWAPFFSCVFFTFIFSLQARLQLLLALPAFWGKQLASLSPVLLLQGRPDLILPTIQRKLIPMLLANYALWCVLWACSIQHPSSASSEPVPSHP